MIKFEKVSYNQFRTALLNTNDDLDENDIEAVYNSIELPTRATSGSAGYDFKTPISFDLIPGEVDEILIPTGIRCIMDSDKVLNLYPRSGLGFKYGLALANSTGIIDSDYCQSKNEGHIMVKLTSKKPISLVAGDRIVQGMFVQYFTTDDDTVTASRDGGFGSTGK